MPKIARDFRTRRGSRVACVVVRRVRDSANGEIIQEQCLLAMGVLAEHGGGLQGSGHLLIH